MPPKSQFLSSLKSPNQKRVQRLTSTITKRNQDHSTSSLNKLAKSPANKPISRKKYDDSEESSDDEPMVNILNYDSEEDEDDEVEEDHEDPKNEDESEEVDEGDDECEDEQVDEDEDQVGDEDEDEDEEEKSDDDEDELALSLPSQPKATSSTQITKSDDNLAPLDITSNKALRKAEKYLNKERQKGICYISRIPPQMGPKRMRLLLQPYGELDRIFLQPEDIVKTLKRKKMHGQGGKRYEGGWIEFIDKRKAKRAALLLHGTPMGQKKRNKFANDYWQIEYKSGMKWEDLRQQHMHQKELREHTLREEIAQAKRDASEYVEKVEMANRKEKMMASRKRRGADLEPEYKRTFHQRKTIVKDKDFDE